MLDLNYSRHIDKSYSRRFVRYIFSFWCVLLDNCRFELKGFRRLFPKEVMSREAANENFWWPEMMKRIALILVYLTYQNSYRERSTSQFKATKYRKIVKRKTVSAIYTYNCYKLYIITAAIRTSNIPSFIPSFLNWTSCAMTTTEHS